MKSLVSFISEGPEEKKKDKLRILVVSKKEEDGELPRTAKRISDKGKKGQIQLISKQKEFKFGVST